jgi:hypothetical protein
MSLSKDINWGKRVWGEYPSFFNLSSFIRQKKDSNFKSKVRSGDIWYALPEDCSIGLYDFEKGKYCPGFIDGNGTWHPCEEKSIVGPEVGKLIFKEGPPPYLSVNHFRPGLILGEPLTPLNRKKHKSGVANLFHYNRAIFIPGVGSGYFVSPYALCLKYNKGLGLSRKKGIYQFWKCWGISSIVGEELLAYLCDSRSYKLIWGALSDSLTPTASKRLLAEVLGILTTKNPPKEKKKKETYKRGEVVKVQFHPEKEAVPCVVVSPNELNEWNLDVVVVLRCIPYEENDEEKTTVIPLGKNGKIPGVLGQWSIDITLIRGITMASKRVKKYNERILLKEETFQKLVRRMEFIYG